MKLKTTGRIAKATLVSLALGLGLTACTRDYTVAYVYVTTAKANPGLIDAYGVDYQSGALVPLADSPIPAGRNPVALTSSISKKTGNVFLFVVNHDDSTVGAYAVGTDGKIYPQKTYNTNGSFPVAAAVDADGAFLYVAYTYQPGYSPASTGPGGISIFPISYSGDSGQETVSLGTPTPVNIGNNPVGIIASKFNHFVYVVDAEPGTSTTSPVGEVLGFKENSDGTLTALPGVSTLPATGGLQQYHAGVTPSAIVENPLASYVYVTDQASNQLFGYLVQGDGSLTPMLSSPFVTGQFPSAVTIEPRGSFLYVTNFNASTVNAYAINQGNGALTATATAGNIPVRTNPVGITVEPALGIYLFTANQTDGTVSGEQLSPNNGTLKDIQHTPFPASGLPTAILAIANGEHLTSDSVTTPK